MNRYGVSPLDLGNIDISCPEMMAYLYLPIKMKDSDNIRLEPRLKVFEPLIYRAFSVDNPTNKYVYLTAKKIYVEAGSAGNRMGWHCDGFLTDDINYIWSDMNPTEYCVQDFDIESHHSISMTQFNNQAKEENIISFANKSLVRMDQYVVHRVSPKIQSGMRTFVKISISDEKYNLKDNSHNYLFDYDWKMYDRSIIRNHPIKKELDYVLDA